MGVRIMLTVNNSLKFFVTLECICFHMVFFFRFIILLFPRNLLRIWLGFHEVLYLHFIVNYLFFFFLIGASLSRCMTSADNYFSSFKHYYIILTTSPLTILPPSRSRAHPLGELGGN